MTDDQSEPELLLDVLGAGLGDFVSVFVAVEAELFDSDELLEPLESDELLEPLESDELEVSLVEPDGFVDDVLPRLSFLKNPLPLKVTPTGWNTFFTAITSPESGCAYSLSVSSWNDC